MITLYIAPGNSQSRIYRRRFDEGVKFVPYEKDPASWKEVGLMNYQGNLVCFDGPQDQRQELIDGQPLMAGTYYEFDQPKV